MFLPLAFMSSWTSLSLSCCAATAPIPSSKAPTTTTVLIIRQFPFRSLCRFTPNFGYRRSNPAPGGSFPSVEHSQAVPPLVLADRDPDPLGRRRHVDVVDLVL